jgi:hypothetical protein
VSIKPAAAKHDVWGLKSFPHRQIAAIFNQSVAYRRGEVRMTNIDLINWTVQEAQYLKRKPCEPESIDDGIPSLDAFLAMMESEPAMATSPQSDGAGTAENQIGVAQRADEALPHDKAIGVTGAAEAASPTSAQVVSSTLTEEQPVRVISPPPTSISVTGVQVVAAPHDAPGVPEPTLSDSPPVTRAAPSTSPEAQDGPPAQALLMALKQTDYRTARADRERAIVLRWALRDILGKRLKLSPINHNDLQTLMAFGLVEMQGDSPTLTQAGLGVIA